MSRVASRVCIVAASSILLALAGCSSYYRVSDPDSGKQYYTTSIGHKAGGAIEFKDAKSGSTVTVQNSEVSKIKKGEYDTAVGKK